ncbi:tyrosine-type recombinase/integrase, partial [Tautonia marina]|uniref:tyrosine-type recombinase/integrase n=1 Tax=Tautonia marina TaxID=2653855 RepID=UPI001260B0EF
RLSKRTGIYVYAYAFRHRFATRKLAEGVAPAVVAQLMNHSDLSMISKHYSHIGTMHSLMRDAID